jgi:hypothetical protein
MVVNRGSEPRDPLKHCRSLRGFISLSSRIHLALFADSSRSLRGFIVSRSLQTVPWTQMLATSDATSRVSGPDGPSRWGASLLLVINFNCHPSPTFASVRNALGSEVWVETMLTFDVTLLVTMVTLTRDSVGHGDTSRHQQN